MLPRLDLPTYKLFIKSINKEIKYRPFTVGEQEILLRAKPDDSSYDKNSIINAVYDVIEKCTFSKIDIKQLPVFEVILLFIKIRCVSVEDTVKFTYIDKTSDKQDKIIVNVDLKLIEIKYPENHKNKIMITDEIGIVMKYPTLQLYEETSKTSEIEFIVSCIDSIFDSESVYPSSDATKEELISWYKEIPFTAKLQIKEYFDTMPHIYHSIDVKLRNGKTQKLEYRRLEDFFI